MSENQDQPAGAVTILYTNWRGETAARAIVPISLKWGSNEWHPEPQWMILATDIDKNAQRWFALSGVKAWGWDAVLTAPRHKIIEAADTPASIGPGDLALTIEWPCGAETVEHVSEQAAAALGYRWPVEGPSTLPTREA